VNIGQPALPSTLRSIHLGDRAVVRRCALDSYAGRGPSFGNDCLIEDTLVRNFEINSLSTGDGCTVRNVSVEGIFMSAQASFGARCIIEDCKFGGGSASGTNDRFSTGDGSIIRGCTATGSSFSQASVIGANSLAVDCTFSGYSLSLGENSRIQRCTLRRSQGFPAPNIALSSRCSLVGCTIVRTTNDPCVTVSSGTCLIDSNSIVGQDPTLVSLTGSASRVMRNSFTGSVSPVAGAAGNDIGPIGTAATATSPWANLVN
jgi:hypothetical protein